VAPPGLLTLLVGLEPALFLVVAVEVVALVVGEDPLAASLLAAILVLA